MTETINPPHPPRHLPPAERSGTLGWLGGAAAGVKRSSGADPAQLRPRRAVNGCQTTEEFAQFRASIRPLHHDPFGMRGVQGSTPLRPRQPVATHGQARMSTHQPPTPLVGARWGSQFRFDSLQLDCCRNSLFRIKAARKRAAPAALGLLAAQAPASAGAPANKSLASGGGQTTPRWSCRTVQVRGRRDSKSQDTGSACGATTAARLRMLLVTALPAA